MTSCTSHSQLSRSTEQPIHLVNTDSPTVPQISTPEALLAHLSGQPIDPIVLDSGLIFLATSVTLLSGIMALNKQVGAKNEPYLQSVLDAALQNGVLSPHLVQALVEGIEHDQLYLKPQLFLLLASALSESERLLLLGLGYDMATAGTDFGIQTRLYLRAIAQRLRIPQPYQACLEASFTDQDIDHLDALPNLADLTHPTSFQPASSLLHRLAHRIYPNMERLALLASA
ncbi:hypothetical protein [Vacuolonema iberomarrocanum]|uniref:hypothetical protein n=1 Tax=Vacuolonema iberomarrocanum TaxID=3454632 RepID=UPI0019EE4BF6|nr:hypothetical protein [filamentous cyanobacterium LEGE 07170]